MRRYSAMLALGIVVVSLLFCFPSLAAKKSAYGISSFAKYVQIPGAKPVGSNTCTTCHAEVANNFRHAFHAQQGVECEECHGAGSLHVEGGGDISKIEELKSLGANIVDPLEKKLWGLRQFTVKDLDGNLFYFHHD